MTGHRAIRALKRLARAALGKRAPDQSAPRPYIWEGVYAHYNDVPALGRGFEDALWARSTRVLTERALEACQTAAVPPVTGHLALLPFLAAILSHQSGDLVRVLDFGGGLGVSFVQTLFAAPHCERVEYHVVEVPSLCLESASLYPHEQRIHFHSQLPAALPGLDVAYISTALQYVTDYAGLLRSLCALSPRYVLLAKCSAGDVPTYASSQMNLEGKRIPYWFLNLMELTSILHDAGYKLLFKGTVEPELDQSNLPEAYRLRHHCNLLFGRIQT